MTFLTNILRPIREAWDFRHEPERLRQLADVYWGALLFVAACVILGAILYGGFKFLSVLASKSAGVPTTGAGGGNLLKSAELEAVLDGFAREAKEFESLKNNLPKNTDPSR